MAAGVIALIATGWVLATTPAPEVEQQTIAVEPAAEESKPLIAGRTLDEWRELMKSVDLQDPERGQYVPGLIEIVQSPQLPWFTRRQAAQTLGRWGTLAADAVPVLERLLNESGQHPDETTCFWALKGLSLFGPVAASAVPSIVHVALDSNQSEEHRLAAMECLSQIGVTQPVGLQPLIQIAQSTGEDRGARVLRRGAVEAIGLYRGGAALAVPALLHCLEDIDADIRREAAAALGKQGNAAEIAQPALFDRMVGDTDGGVRDAAGIALSQTGPAIIPALIEVLEADDAELRWRGAQTLGRFGRRAVASSAGLERTWDDPMPQVQLAALEASWRVTGRGEEIAPRVARLLAVEERNLRRQAYLLLVAMGPAASNARVVLEELRAHPRAEIRNVAAKVLSQLIPPGLP